MKKIISLMIAGMLCLQLMGCGTPSAAAEPERPIPEEYEAILRQYGAAVREGWDVRQMMDNGLNYMVAYCLQEDERANVGYFIGDIDGDGQDELAITAESESEDYNGMIFTLYRVIDGQPMAAVESHERDRWYYAPEGRLYNEAYGNAFASVYSLCTADWQLAYLDAVGCDPAQDADDPWLRFTGDTWEHISEDEATAVRTEMKNSVAGLPVTAFP